jgi:hypothetical protein
MTTYSDVNVSRTNMSACFSFDEVGALPSCWPFPLHGAPLTWPMRQHGWSMQSISCPIGASAVRRRAEQQYRDVGCAVGREVTVVLGYAARVAFADEDYAERTFE